LQLLALQSFIIIIIVVVIIIISAAVCSGHKERQKQIKHVMTNVTTAVIHT
jgi:hypothetical protein